MKPLYSIENKKFEDIHGTIEENRLLIYKKIGMSYNDVLTLDRVIQGNMTIYKLTVQYLGQDWRYMDTIILNIDGKIVTLKDKNPSHDINTGSNVTVTEIVSCTLDQSLIDALKSASSIKIQYYSDPIAIPQEGVTAITAFL